MVVLQAPQRRRVGRPADPSGSRLTRDKGKGRAEPNALQDQEFGEGGPAPTSSGEDIGERDFKSV
jgi:hypothetical protein